MDSKLLPNRRQITIAIMKHADLDNTMSKLREKIGEDAVSNKDANVVIGSMYKHLTDTMFYLGRTISRTLDPEYIKDDEDFVSAVDNIKTIIELMDSFVSGVKSQVRRDPDTDFMDIIDGLDMGDFDFDEDTGQE